MATTVKTFAATTTWVCPPGVTTIQVEAYGGGGAGGAATGSPAAGGGGAGGAYAKKATYAVVPGTTYTVTVGATKTTLTTNTQAQNKGNDSWFSSNDTNGVVAEGGLGGNPATVNSTNGAVAAGSSAASFGDGGAVFKGGDGAAGVFNTKGGAGGGGAGSGGNGGSGGVGTGVGGTGTSNNTAGTGGTGPTPSAVGGNGVAWGGGGAGGAAGTATDRVGGSGLNGAIVLTYTTPLMEKLQDNFDTNSMDATKWTLGLSPGTPTNQIKFQNKEVEITNDTVSGNYYTVSSIENYDLTGSVAAVRVVSAGPPLANASAVPIMMEDTAAGVSKVFISISNVPSLQAFKVVASVQTQVGTDIAYNSTTMKWVRIRESGGTTFFEYSGDGVAWTTFQSLANPITVTSLLAAIQCGQFGVQASTFTVKYDNFNVPESGEECFQPTGQPTSHYQPVWISA